MTQAPGPDRAVVKTRVLAQAVSTAALDAPIEKVDICEWLRTLPDREFQRCAPPDHKAAGYSVTDDGRPMSVTVEMIGDSLFVQHYVYETAFRDRCRLVSAADVLTPAGWTTCEVVWELRADPADHRTSRYTSAVTSYPTEGFLRFIAASGQRFAEVAAAAQAALVDHCRRETPLYAESVGRHANALG